MQSTRRSFDNTKCRFISFSIVNISFIFYDDNSFIFYRFRSAFVNDHDITNSISNIDTFVAFSIRLCKVFEQNLSTSVKDSLPIVKHSQPPILRLQTISNIIELYPFFSCLAHMHMNDNLYIRNGQVLSSDITNEIETSILEDFVESWIYF